MNTLVVYTSATGFTQRYAQWIADETGFPMVTLKEAKKMDLSNIDRIVYGGWIHAALIAGINDIWKLAAGKTLLLFAVGGAPMNDETVQNVAKALPEQLRGTEFVYCPGGFNYEKMKAGSRIMMKMFSKMMSSKKNKTKADEEMTEMIQHSYDISDKKYVEGLIQALKG